MGQYHEQHKRHKRAAQPTLGEVQLVQQNSDERYLRAGDAVQRLGISP
jgi:hypothetical protein